MFITFILGFSHGFPMFFDLFPWFSPAWSKICINLAQDVELNGLSSIARRRGTRAMLRELPGPKRCRKVTCDGTMKN
jgi:hypothetical protein